jgi:quinolinate synthase
VDVTGELLGTVIEIMTDFFAEPRSNGDGPSFVSEIYHAGADKKKMKRRIEVSVRQLNREDRTLFVKAKAKEWTSWLDKNAVEIVNAIPANQEILFLPDMFLGAHVRRESRRENIHVWLGECHVHAGIDPEHISNMRAQHPGAEFLIHPECGCATPVVEAISAGAIDADNVHILSTEGMIKRPSQTDQDTFIVATEIGILHRLRRANPTKHFIAANDRAQCAYMKVTTLPKVRDALLHMQHRITVPDDIAARARISIARMVSIGGNSGVSPFGPEDPGE